MGVERLGRSWLGAETVGVAADDIETEVLVVGACCSVDGSIVFLARVPLGVGRR